MNMKYQKVISKDNIEKIFIKIESTVLILNLISSIRLFWREILEILILY